MTMDLANFYLGTPLDRPEYVQIQINVIPLEFIDEYDLMCFAHNEWVGLLQNQQRHIQTQEIRKTSQRPTT
jgi:hypothetical protein